MTNTAIDVDRRTNECNFKTLISSGGSYSLNALKVEIDSHNHAIDIIVPRNVGQVGTFDSIVFTFDKFTQKVNIFAQSANIY